MRQIAETRPNPGQLKLELGRFGLQIDDSARPRATVRDDGPAQHPHGVELVLPEEVWVSAPVRDQADATPFVLYGAEDRFVLRSDRNAVDVRLIDPPAFYRQSTLAGTAMRSIGTVHGSFVAITFGAGCGFSSAGGPCPLCRSEQGSAARQSLPSVPDVVEVIRAAFAEGAAEFVYFRLCGGAEPDGGIASVERHIRAVKSNFDTAVAVQMHPPADHRWIDETYAMGVDAVSYPLEVFDEEHLRRLCPGRARRTGRRGYFDALKHAAGIFPSGPVIGTEPAESTRRGIDALASLGVLPVLSLPAEAPSWDSLSLDLGEILPLYAHLFEAVRQARINMGWIRDLSFAITPLEARFFAGEDARISALEQFYRSRLGQSTARSLARLRRRLRVRRVSDSFDSSHL